MGFGEPPNPCGKPRIGLPATRMDEEGRGRTALGRRSWRLERPQDGRRPGSRAPSRRLSLKNRLARSESWASGASAAEVTPYFSRNVWHFLPRPSSRSGGTRTRASASTRRWRRRRRGLGRRQGPDTSRETPISLGTGARAPCSRPERLESDARLPDPIQKAPNRPESKGLDLRSLNRIPGARIRFKRLRSDLRSKNPDPRR
jgi:hypothetical protein